MSVGFLDRLAGQPLALLSDAFERSPVAKAVTSLAAGSVGDLVEVNAAFCTMVGRSRAELLAGDHPEIARLDDRPAGLTAGERTEADGEWRFTHPDGVPVRVRLRSVVAHDAAGVAYAVTELVEAADRHAAAESEARFRAAFDTAPIGMAVLDEDNRFVRINTAFEVMLGRDRVELLGTGLADLIHPDDLAGEPAATDQTGQRYVRRDGSVVWVRATSTGIAGPAGERHRLVHCEDLTVRRQAEQVADREHERLRTTIEVQRELTEAADDRAAVLRLITDRALRVLPAGSAAVVNLIDGTGDWLLPVAGVGSLSEQTAPRVPVAGSLAGAAIAARATLRTDDTRTDPRASRSVSRSLAVRSLVVAPLLAAGRPIGVLVVSSTRPGAFDHADEQRLTLLADALTGALRHAEDVAHQQELLQRANGAVRALEHERTAALAALDRLAQSESRFAEVFDHSPVAKIVVGLRDADRGRILLANPAFGRLLGYRADQTAGLTVAEIAPVPLDLDPSTAGGRLVQAAELRHRDGALIAVDAHISAIADDQGPASAVIQLRDVTADRAAEAALARSEEQFRTAFDGSPIGLLIADETGRFQRVNPAAEALTGRPAADLLGLTHRDITDPADLEASVRARLELLRGAAEVQYDKRLRHADGTLSWTRVTLTMTPGPAGRKWRLVQLQDITAERAAALTTEREVQRLRATLAVQRDVTAAAADRDTALRVVADRAVDLFASADTAAVQLLDGDQLHCVAVANRSGPVAGTEITLAGSLSGLVITTGVPAHCADTSLDNRVDRTACRRAGIGSMLVAPLRAEDRVIGCLMIAATRPDAFDDLDEQQLELLAESLGSALRHADDAARNTAALNALAASEARFRLAFENSPLGLTLISVGDDDLGTYLHANPAMTTITGYSAAELCRMSYRDLTFPEDLPSAEEMGRLFAQDFPAARLDRRYRHKDGHAVDVSLRLAAVRDADGQVLYLVNQVEDVTAQRAAEAQLRWQARLLELIPAAIIVRDLDGTIRWWNAGAERLYGWPLTAAAGRNAHRLLGTVFPGTTTAQDVEEALVRDGSWDGSLQHLTGDGRSLTVLSQHVLHGPAQVLEINTDVTAARAAELALAESEQRFRAQFSHSAAGQLIRTVDGSVVEVNPAYAAMLGHPVERFRTLADLDVLHPDDVAETDRRIAMLFAREADSFTLEGRLRHADGHWVDVSSTVSVVRDENNRPKSLICVVTDISARRAAEQARDQAAADLAERNTELEAANHLKLDIIGMLGHEIGNPLSVIRGYTEVLTDDWASLGEARRDRAIHSIARQARRLDDIVREVLGMVTVESGTMVPVRDRLRVREQVQQALAAIDHGDIPVLGDDAGVLVNAGHLQQMLVNLLSNAAKYGGGATAVRILPDGDRVRVQVQDCGPGVPEEFRHRLFERLARAERDAATVRGTGLGLYIVRGLAHANHGDVFHEPNPAGGSIFTLELAT